MSEVFLIRPSFLITFHLKKQKTMKTNLLYAIRNIKNNSVNSIITVVGLSVAIAFFLNIYFLVNQQYNFDTYHQNLDRIYRLNYHLTYIDFDYSDVRLNPVLIDEIKDEVPQVEYCAEYRFAFNQLSKYKDKYFDAETGYASEEFFKIFTYKFIAGTPDDVLKNPYEIVLTKSYADKILGDSSNYGSLLGQMIEFPIAYSKNPFKIVAVIEDVPFNSSINFELLVSGESGRNFGGCDNYFGYTGIYYLLRKGTSRKDTEKNINELVKNHYTDAIERMQKDNILAKENPFEPFIIPYKESHLTGNINSCFENRIDKSNFIIATSIGLLILFIACSNYTILALGQYLKKVGDVGIRKANGANSRDIFSVFLSESFLLTVVSFILGGVFSWMLIPFFENITDLEFHIEALRLGKVIFVVAFICILIVLVASLVPVLVFSKVSPHQMGSNKLNFKGKGRASEVFVSIQYSLSIILIIVTVFIAKQANYMKERPLGFDAHDIIDVSMTRIDPDKKEAFKLKVLENPAVINASKTARNFVNGSSDDFITKENGDQVDVHRYKIDERYVPTIGLNLLHGRNFTENNVSPNDRSAIVNHKFTELMEIEDDPIGYSFFTWGVRFTVIGVVEDFLYFGSYREIGPFFLFTRSTYGNPYNDLLVKHIPGQQQAVIDHIRACYEEIAPGKELVYTIWNDRLRDRYDDADRWSRIIGYASIIAIIISSLGLFGLTILIINQRIKEIGVRKVNGARSSEVMLTINKTFVTWLIFSIIAAIPISYYIVNLWLSNFAFKTDVSWWVFIGAGILAIVIALLTVSYHSLRAATRNPVEALRYE